MRRLRVCCFDAAVLSQQQVRRISIAARVKRYFLVSPRQQARMQETPYSDRKAEELRRERIMGFDNALRSSGSAYYDKSRQEFSVDNTFILPFAVFAIFIMAMISYATLGKNQSTRDHQLKALDERYGLAKSYVQPKDEQSSLPDHVAASPSSK